MVLEAGKSHNPRASVSSAEYLLLAFIMAFLVYPYVARKRGDYDLLQNSIKKASPLWPRLNWISYQRFCLQTPLHLEVRMSVNIELFLEVALSCICLLYPVVVFLSLILCVSNYLSYNFLFHSLDSVLSCLFLSIFWDNIHADAGQTFYGIPLY